MRGSTFKGQSGMSGPDEFIARMRTGVRISRIASSALAPTPALEARLENWRRVVLTRGDTRGTCALWAAWYVSLRDLKSREERPRGIAPDILDGWVVEAAWRALPNHVSKWILRYRYVFNMGQEQIQTRLWRVHHVRLRGRQFDVAVETALGAIGRTLAALRERDAPLPINAPHERQGWAK